MQEADKSEQLAPGCRVTISGLASRADLNGKQGEVLHFAEEVGRWAVFVLGTGESVRVKPTNLTRRRADSGSHESEGEGGSETWWEQAARCLQEANGDFGVARTSYFKMMEQKLQSSDPELHLEMQAARRAGPGQEARVALTFDTAAAFLKSASAARDLNPGLANDQRSIAKAACHWPVDGSVPDFRPESRVLDVGCGDGAYVPALRECGASEAGYLGIDLSGNMIARARLLHAKYAFERASFMTSRLCAPEEQTGGTGAPSAAAIGSNRASGGGGGGGGADGGSASADQAGNANGGCGPFDTVLFNATLQYLPDTEAAIARAVGCLRRDAPARIVVAQVTGGGFVRREHAKHPTVAVRELPSPSEVKAIGRAHGFTLLPRPADAPPLEDFYLLVLERKPAAEVDVSDQRPCGGGIGERR